MRKYILIPFFILCFTLTSIKAQDPIFSQFYTSAPAINPALSGMFQGTFKANFSYRNQWYSLINVFSYKTEFVSFDYKFNPNNKNVFTLGGMLLNDTAGEGKFRQTRGHVTTSYNMQLSDDIYGSLSHYLSLGFQLGFGQNSIDNSKIWFGRQFDLSIFEVNNTLESGEPVPADKNYKSGVYPDINWGLAWTMIKGRKYSSQVGFSMAHINKPPISTYGSPLDRYAIRYTTSLAFNYLLNPDSGVIPAAVFHVQGPSRIFLVGSSFAYSLKYIGESGFKVGGFFRLANGLNGFSIEGMTISAMFERQNMELGFSYDFTLSKLRLAANSLGGVEFSISYINPLGANYTNPRIPTY